MNMVAILLILPIKGSPAMSLLLPQPQVSLSLSASRIVFANRVYQRVGPSRIDWMVVSPPATRAVKISDAERAGCLANQKSIIATEAKARAESSLGEDGKLLSWSADQTMYAYVARDRSIPPPTPNPWGCADCFYPVLKVARSSDAQVLATVRLPEFGEHWNYATSVNWSPDGKTLLVGGEAGPSDSKFEDYWLLDWVDKKWRYVGGGNAAKWSPDSAQILWSTARTLELLGKIRVWVVHLAVVDVRTLKQTLLTSGTSYVSEFYWCST